MKISGEHDDGGLHERHVALVDGVEDEPAEPRPGEDRLDHDDAAQHEAELEPDHGDDRQPGIAQRMADDHVALREALGAGGADKVLAEHLQHGGAHEPRIARDREEGDRERRHRDVGRSGGQVREGAPQIAAQAAARGRARGPRSAASRGLRPKKRIIMIPSQKLGIDWPNMAIVMMLPSTAVPRFSAARMPSGTARPMARHDGDERQLDGRRKVLEHDVERLRLVGERGAEIAAAARPPRNVSVLHMERPVEAELGAGLCDLLGGRPLADVEVGRVAAEMQRDELMTVTPRITKTLCSRRRATKVHIGVFSGRLESRPARRGRRAGLPILPSAWLR